MNDYKKDMNNEIFKTAVENSELIFSVVEIYRKIREAEGDISTFLKNKKTVSDNFLKKFFKAYNLNLEYIKEDINIVNEPSVVYINKTNYNLKTSELIPYYEVDFIAGNSVKTVETNITSPNCIFGLEKNTFFKKNEFLLYLFVSLFNNLPVKWI